MGTERDELQKQISQELKEIQREIEIVDEELATQNTALKHLENLTAEEREDYSEEMVDKYYHSISAKILKLESEREVLEEKLEAKKAELTEHVTGKMEAFHKQITEAEDSAYKASAREEYQARVIRVAKKMIFESYQSSDLQTNGINKLKNYDLLKAAVKWIVEEVMELTPEEYDCIWSNTLNTKACIDYAIRKLVNGADSKTNASTLFHQKKTLLKLVWPEHYAKHYSEPVPWDIFDAKGEVKSALIKAGKPKEFISATETEGREELSNGKFSSRKERKHNYNHGDEVDSLLYWAMSNVFQFIEIKTIDLFSSLANPKSCGWNKYGFVQIIAARKCYPSPLDFYMLNSPQEYQLAHLEEYMTARQKAGLKPVPALDVMYEAYMKSVRGDDDYDEI